MFSFWLIDFTDVRSKENKGGLSAGSGLLGRLGMPPVCLHLGMRSAAKAWSASANILCSPPTTCSNASKPLAAKPHPDCRASREFILIFARLTKGSLVTMVYSASCLLGYNQHAPQLTSRCRCPSGLLSSRLKSKEPWTISSTPCPRAWKEKHQFGDRDPNHHLTGSSTF